VPCDSRPDNDLTDHFPLIVEALANLRIRSCIIDGEAVACDDNGLAVFDGFGISATMARSFRTPSTLLR
jgi:ATP-dependent DNA ligase